MKATPGNPETQNLRTPSSQKPTWFYHVMALSTVLIWSFSFLHIVNLNEAIDPISVVVLRKDIFAIGLVGFLIWRRPKLGHLTRRDWGLVLAMSLLSGPMYHFTFAWASGEGRISVALLGLIIATIPIHTGWLGWLILKEKLSVMRGIALALGLAGVVVVLFGQNEGLVLLPQKLAGPIAATCAAMFASLGMILTRANRGVLGPLDLFAVSGVVVVVIAAMFHPVADFERIGAMGLEGWGSAIFLGTFGSGIAYLTWVAALTGLQAVTVAMYLFLASVLATLWGWVFRGEEVNWMFALGGVMVLAGLLLPALVQNWKGRNEPEEAIEPVLVEVEADA
ncbi:MAG: DMT family transporter [Planctomycetota bacterium]|nr:DMT family transporter [Planctomycetota bacterium]